mmetsp:Transcript_10948/g.67679  ORF Transcript_10948/g.67679 Transcript_10948/m.67679 type:complete len:118 (+) Transcript_10948:373-726(+)
MHACCDAFVCEERDGACVHADAKHVRKRDGRRVQEEAVIDDLINRLLDVRNGRPGKQVQLAEGEIRKLCLTAKDVFMSQPNLLELEAPIKICGASVQPNPSTHRLGQCEHVEENASK